LSNSYFRVNVRHLSDWSYGADRRLRLYSGSPNDFPWPDRGAREERSADQAERAKLTDAESTPF
jgi:hypothetical protein